MKEKRTGIWLPVLFGLMLLTSCQWDRPPQPPRFPLAPVSSGSTLVQVGNYVYRLGGQESTGTFTPKVWYAALSDLNSFNENNPSIWSETAALPIPLGYGFAFAAGNLIYYVGGEDNSGMKDSVYFTLINSDGTLGFSSSGWIQNPRKLPHTLSRMGGVYHDGRVFLIGGVTQVSQSENSPVDSIIQARLWMDGQVGQWYLSSQKLKESLSLPGISLFEDQLVVAGGQNLYTPLSAVQAFPLGTEGFLGSPLVLPELPEPLSSPLLLTANHDLWVLGGGKGNSLYSDKSYSLKNFTSATWVQNWTSTPVLGPQGIYSKGSIWYLRSPAHASPGSLGLFQVLLAPPEPIIFPGSGLVGSNQPLLYISVPDVTVRYRILGVDESKPSSLNETDPILDLNYRSQGILSMVFQSFYPGQLPSRVISRHYTSLSSSMFVLIGGTLQWINQPAQGTLPDLNEIRLEQRLSDGTAINQKSVIYKLTISSAQAGKPFFLQWADIADGYVMQNSIPYTSTVLVSLYETDMKTWALDSQGIGVNKRNNGWLKPVEMKLGEGDYYIFIEDQGEIPLSGNPPKTLGIILYSKSL